MIKKHRILVSAAAAVLGASAIAVPVAVTMTQRSALSNLAATGSNALPKASTDAPVPVNRTSYAATEINPLPGVGSADEVLTPPQPLVLTDNATLAVGASALPLPKLPMPPAGYAPWNQSVTYSLEGTNEAVTSESLPTLSAGAVVLVTATCDPAEGHSGPQYVATVRFEIQPLPVVRPVPSTMLASRYAAYTSIDQGSLPSADQQAIAPPSQEANGYLPWDKSRMVKSYVDSRGVSHPLSTTYDWARMVNVFKNDLSLSNASTGAVFTIVYVWTTAPDKNHYDPLGDGTITYETRLLVTRQVSVSSAGVAGNLPLQHADYFLEGRNASITTMNQFGTIPYQVERSANGVAVGAIKPYDFPASAPVTMADGNAYPYTTSNGSSDRILLNYWMARLGKQAANVADPVPGVPYVTMGMVLNNYQLPGTDFNVFGAVPADTAVAPHPLVSISYDAANVDAAVRMMLQLNVSYNFVNWMYLVTPAQKAGIPAPTLAAIQRMFAYNQLMKWTRDNYGLADSYGSWYSTSGLVQQSTTERTIVDYAPFIYNSNFLPNGDASGKTSFDFSKFNPSQITQGQFFDVASLSFVPRWSSYSDADKNRVRTSLFQPDSTTLKVGAYVEYKNGKLLVYLIPYIPGLPKVSFAPATGGAGTQNRDLSFAYEFLRVAVSIDRNNDSSLGWWS